MLCVLTKDSKDFNKENTGEKEQIYFNHKNEDTDIEISEPFSKDKKNGVVSGGVDGKGPAKETCCGGLLPSVG